MSLKQPVQYPVKYYSHLDAGAPQISDTNGAIKTILKAGLITGIGAKAGAGWIALFEDDFRMVLRRPLRTGNPPDIKIENGISNRHQIISQDNPTSITDTKKLASVNLLARDYTVGVEWHLIATDFGFLFCYQMGTEGYGSTYATKHILFCGSTQKMRDADSDFFVVNTSSTIELNGTAPGWAKEIFTLGSSFKDMRANVSHTDLKYIDLATSERYFNNDYIMQPFILAERAVMPFYCALSNKYDDLITSTITSDARPMLRIVNRMYDDLYARVFYIPLDYWEL